MPFVWWLLKSLIWSLRALVWNISNFLMLIWFAVGVVLPATQLFGIHLHSEVDLSFKNLFLSSLNEKHISQELVKQIFHFMRVWLPISLVGAFWNPKGLEMIVEPSHRLTGKTEYIRLQMFIQCLRFASLYCVPMLNVTLGFHKRMSTLFLTLSFIHVVLSYNMLTLSPRTQLNLKDNAAHLKDSLPTVVLEDEIEKPTEEALYTIVSSRADEQFHREDEPRISGDSMDWEPSPPPSTVTSPSPFTRNVGNNTVLPRMFPKQVFSQPREQYFSSNTMFRSALPSFSGPKPENETQRLVLAQQKFFPPDRPTGLENLFSAAVRLEDEPLLVRSIKSIQRTPRLAALLLLGLSVLLIPLAYFHFRVASICLGSSIALGSLYFGVLDRSRWMCALLIWPVQVAINGIPHAGNNCAPCVLYADKLQWATTLVAIALQIILYTRTRARLRNISDRSHRAKKKIK